MVFKHPAERADDGERRRFEQFAELASNFTSSSAFAAFCVVLVGAFVAVYAAGVSAEWQHVVGDSMSAVTLLLLALLKNSERRAEHAIQRKLDAIANALIERDEGETENAQDDLQSVIRMDERL